MRKIYLDYNATTPLRPEALQAMTDALGVTGNASSIHGFGRDARKFVEDARAHVAALVNVRPAQIIFNSGATEGNNTILSGYEEKLVLALATEHPSILEAAPNAEAIPVLKDGTIDLEKFTIMLNHADPALVCVQLVNSETGVIQPIAEIVHLAKTKGAKVHCDAVQAAGRIKIDFKSLGVDFLTLSAHKFGGPQGIGALVFREGLILPKLLRGGGQEKRQRAGTENVAAIAGFGAAAKRVAAELNDYQTTTKDLQDRLEQGLRAIANDLIIVSESAKRVTNTTNVLLPNAPAETQLMAMDLEGVAVSSGSACSSGTFKASHVLAAMGYKDEMPKSALRFSYGWATTASEIDDAIAAYAKMAARVRT